MHVTYLHIPIAGMDHFSSQLNYHNQTCRYTDTYQRWDDRDDAFLIFYLRTQLFLMVIKKGTTLTPYVSTGGFVLTSPGGEKIHLTSLVIYDRGYWDPFIVAINQMTVNIDTANIVTWVTGLFLWRSNRTVCLRIQRHCTNTLNETWGDVSKGRYFSAILASWTWDKGDGEIQTSLPISRNPRPFFKLVFRLLVWIWSESIRLYHLSTRSQQLSNKC